MYSLIKFIITNTYFLLWVVLAVYLLVISRKRKKQRIISIAILALFWIIASRPVAEMAITPLENAYSAPDIDSLRNSEARDIVVLGGGSFPPKGEQLYSALLSESSSVRYLTALELCTKLGPEYRIIHTGAGSRQDLCAKFQHQLTGVLAPQRESLMEIESRRTVEHPQHVGELLSNKTFIMVTTASHIPRSMAMFRDAGYNPIPYPVGQSFRYPFGKSDIFPSIRNLRILEKAIYEYIGYVYYLLTS